jgi:hypothetical protein
MINFVLLGNGRVERTRKRERRGEGTNHYKKLGHKRILCASKCTTSATADTNPDLASTSAKCNYVTGSLWECLRVVGPESQGGQIPELTGPTQWPSGAPGSTWEHRRQDWECRRQAWEHLGARTTSLGAPATSLGAPATSLGAPRITVEQSGRNNIFFGNTAGAPGNHSYYLSFNDFYNSCIQFVFSSMYLCI